jgi:N-acetylmuramoyl-L-alanine amidase
VLKLLETKYSCRLKLNLQKETLICERFDRNNLCLTGGRDNIIQISKNDLSNGSIIEITLTEHLSYQTLWVPPHFIVNVTRGVLNKHLLKKQEWKGTVRAVSTVQEDSLAQITVYLPQAVDTVETSYSEANKKISVLVRNPFPAERMKPDVKEKSGKTKKTIVIDPGHGGRDPGASFKGVREKDITLSVAKKIRTQLKKKGFEVLLTRNTDVYIELKDRPKFASYHGGDLFISLHCNAISGTPKKMKKIKGFVAYILRAGESEEDKALARRENQAVMETKNKQDKTEISPVEWILLEHELNLYSHQSERFAEKIVENFTGGKIKKHRTGAHQAGFFVLVGAFMPAVLFEIGFITNDKDRKYMSSRSGQKEIAQRLANAVSDFFK